MTKPPYRVPLMTEIAAIEPNGLRVISLFAGCGGSSLGYRMAGFRILLASEFIDAARETYMENAANGTIVDGHDIREVDPWFVMTLLKIGPGELDVLDGSPPCSSFSMVGRREEHWGQEKKYSDKKQRTDDLFFEYVRFLRALRPKVFVAENVAGLVRGTAKGYFLEILRELKACGYRVEARLLDAQWLGVPQQRERLIFVGVREDLGLDPAFPKPLLYRYSLREAFEGVDPTIEPEADISRYAIGDAYDLLNPGEWSTVYQSLGKNRWGDPSFTITASGGSTSTAAVCHPSEKRKYSIAELKRVGSFPDDFVLTGTFAQKWERVGRAVPPMMMKAVAEAIRDEIFARLPAKTGGQETRSEGRSNTGKPTTGAATKRGTRPKKGDTKT